MYVCNKTLSELRLFRLTELFKWSGSDRQLSLGLHDHRNHKRQQQPGGSAAPLEVRFELAQVGAGNEQQQKRCCKGFAPRVHWRRLVVSPCPSASLRAS